MIYIMQIESRFRFSSLLKYNLKIRLNFTKLRPILKQYSEYFYDFF